MSESYLQIPWIEIRTLDQLSSEDQNLIIEAKAATNLSYSPYSGFRVGAAVRMKDGSILKAANQENAVYPAGICAERCVCTMAGFQQESTIDTIVVCARRDQESNFRPVSPCGECRQTLLEYEQRQKTPLRILFQFDENRLALLSSVSWLLPFRFSSDNL